MGVVLRTLEHERLEGPSIFLAGPIQGTEDWQSKAIDYIQRNAPEIDITSPRGPDEHYETELTEEEAEVQANWDTRYLQRAADTGAILFWLAKETEHLCTESYAQTTRAELFNWKVHYEIGGVDLAIGIEEGFSGAWYIRKKFQDDCPGITLYDTLEETCDEAINLVRA